MAQLKDILEVEARRNESSDYSTVYLYQEGNFYRAYEFSAWLFCRYVSQIKPTKRETKVESAKDGTMVFVGFPISSRDKYIPENFGVSMIDDKSMAVTLPSELHSDKENVIDLEKDFMNWKQAVQLGDSKKHHPLKDDLRNDLQFASHAHRMSDVILNIMAFPIEQKSPMECMWFLAEIKQQIAQLL